MRVGRPEQRQRLLGEARDCDRDRSASADARLPTTRARSTDGGSAGMSSAARWVSSRRACRSPMSHR